MAPRFSHPRTGRLAGKRPTTNFRSKPTLQLQRHLQQPPQGARKDGRSACARATRPGREDQREDLRKAEDILRQPG
ncbi:hypothetical protein HPB51_005304 [Rhipicephalus microplus]|uniref:Uncharacterized protein n=1 Tax=Rhipicephalus microplus TaxID=6941 RepID=A0A9J6EYS2_RHIMP|nr:hypothetical protein HPB51_005304 [Rhipicephalus microplus]